MIGPEVQQLTAELTPVVTEDPRRRTSLDFEPIQYGDDMFAAKTLAHLSRVNTSTTVRARTRRPSVSWSATKSNVQTSFGFPGLGRTPRSAMDFRRRGTR